MSRVKVFIQLSNERIKKYEEELERIRNAMSYDEMSCEEYALAHPNFAVDALHKPTFWPHLPEFQHDKEDLSFFRTHGLFPQGPDEYYPATEPYVYKNH